LQFRADVAAFAPTHVLYVDWTGALLANALFSTTLPHARDSSGKLPPAMVYLNFRIFSANQMVAASSADVGSSGSAKSAEGLRNESGRSISRDSRDSSDSSDSRSDRPGVCAESDVAFYRRHEAAAVAAADVSVAACPADAAALDRLRLETANQATAIAQTRKIVTAQSSARLSPTPLLLPPPLPPPPPCMVLNPPLRDDLGALARAHAAAAAATEKAKVAPRMPRKWLLCCARLSPEKAVEHFVDAVEAAGCDYLAALGATPRLVGSGPDAAYVTALRQRLLKACPDAVTTFHCSPFISCIFSLLLCFLSLPRLLP
jgi:hypothetical protein